MIAAFTLLAVAGTGLSWLLWGWTGVAGCLIGLGGVTANLWILWRVIGLAGRGQSVGASRAASLLLVLGLLLKLPLLMLLGLAAGSLGPGGLDGFLVGLAAVYLCLFAFGFVDARRKLS